MPRLFGILMGLALALGAPLIRAETLWLGTTTTLRDSGFLDAIIPQYEAATGNKVVVLAQPTGLALQNARDGNVDLLLTHERTAEQDFVDAGYGLARVPLMRSRFVIIGPVGDPAGAADKTTPDAMARIYAVRANPQVVWLTRGDDSGTAIAEDRIWQSLGIANDPEWRLVTGQGMGATLNIAAAKSAYLLSEIASFAAHQNKSDLVILSHDINPVENEYAILTLNPERFAKRKLKLAGEFALWLSSNETKQRINGFAIDGMPVFTAIESKP